MRVEYPQGFERQVHHLVAGLLHWSQRPVQGVADSGCGGRELLKYRPRWVSCPSSRHAFHGVAQQGPPHFSRGGVAGGQRGDCS